MYHGRLGTSRVWQTKRTKRRHTSGAARLVLAPVRVRKASNSQVKLAAAALIPKTWRMAISISTACPARTAALSARGQHGRRRRMALRRRTSVRSRTAALSTRETESALYKALKAFCKRPLRTRSARAASALLRFYPPNRPVLASHLPHTDAANFNHPAQRLPVHHTAPLFLAPWVSVCSPIAMVSP